MTENQRHLFLDEKSSTIILSFLSSHWNQFNPKESNEIKDILSKLKCLPTSEGMKTPNESYIRSSNVSSDLSIIKLYIPQIERNVQEESNEYPVSMEFLKSIGCRTIYIPTSTNDLNNQSNISSDHFQTNEQFIEYLLEKRKYMSENDLYALKTTPCLLGLLDYFFEKVE